MLIIILTHVTQYHLSNPITSFIWNYSHFAVVLFIFCSVSVLLPSYERMEHTVASITRWYKKRVVRLILPFYWYLLAHFSLMIVFPTIFSGNGLKLNFDFILKSVFLTGGIDLNWLVLLFIELALIFPIMEYISRKKSLATFYFLLSTFFVTATLFLPSLHSLYRVYMIIAWSLVTLISILVVKQKLKPLHIFIISGISFGLQFFFLGFFAKVVPIHLKGGIATTHNLISHKYPPDLYYLSYAIFMSFLVYKLTKLHLFEVVLLKRFLTFVSKSSYTLFFIHYIVLDASLRWRLSVGAHLLVVLVTTMGITYLIEKWRGRVVEK
ncbi:hypothetical protein A3D80_02650 [Candidatus Roizmanbacteria bacterium RIFCSPHIGHO2_02_FULL_40_13b]|uniref:Acyltransferase 3 domain-containing protein n=1 Tax=Candidatus Roizmanbacteria bacterium RIFCSPHIGHO2_01_FULL_39_24 TaxID=1802032 RepID=A0A1F7GIS0_9BACT|nr:MAG: hypothetical protein A2799_00820 [Candidatus Roizmanbacteria bacterium RIFCSPHIGHO2_01_FULL_39_24]OGK26754.1 MAG: hypothetical protein A3D80_02650 [Candidatus Roizmanbacteria bacterium RIFCSPHIGHO2_02_FULL_40_13b]OGK48981.1 MAG: hypothetical protein A3A56_02480 [Candidatus Roizmanbacteria bacterium RIFCSPLOWO2_01_FULL_40_32]OGK57502.1 MAG: hypothetical protein A3H83_00655 [Candidatus Roizmanbacteria bacterium RIFCSPLOWO2_02_FULL_39_8]